MYAIHISKSKCNVMHVGSTKGICPQLQVHGTQMQQVQHATYLGDIISVDGTNDLNILSRISKGHGKVTQVMNMLERVTLGSHYFRIALMLRESIFLNSILNNSEVWYGLLDRQINQLEMVDRLLVRKFLDAPVSTPVEGVYLELGILSIGTIIRARRINFLRSLLAANENDMTYKVFITQWNNPVKQDWVLQVKQDLKAFNIEPNLSNLRERSINSFKKLVKVKAFEYEFSRLMKAKNGHSKMDNLSYSKLEMQKYLRLENLYASGARTLFRYRTRMANFGENFREGSAAVNCPLCGLHLDNQEMAFYNCPVIKANVKIRGQYEDIFKKNVSTELVNTLDNISKFREEFH